MGVGVSVGEDLFKEVGCGMMVLLSEMGEGHGNVCMGMQSTWLGDILSIYHICHICLTIVHHLAICIR